MKGIINPVETEFLVGQIEALNNGDQLFNLDRTSRWYKEKAQIVGADVSAINHALRELERAQQSQKIR